jgi:hypothetical protein
LIGIQASRINTQHLGYIFQLTLAKAPRRRILFVLEEVWDALLAHWLVQMIENWLWEVDLAEVLTYLRAS